MGGGLHTAVPGAKRDRGAERGVCGGDQRCRVCGDTCVPTPHPPQLHQCRRWGVVWCVRWERLGLLITPKTSRFNPKMLSRGWEGGGWGDPKLPGVGGAG